MENYKQPFVSIIITTYNREKTLGRAIDSVLNQTFTNFEIVLVDDGSTDNTNDLLGKYTDERIRIIKHKKNRGVTATKNTGMNNVRGEWFCFIDSDDEIVPEALTEMFDVLPKIDSKVNWILCNCTDSVTGQLSNNGLDQNQYLDIKTRLNAKGDLWGILKTDLIGSNRFNENLPGYENTFWFALYEKAYRYYIHKGYLIYHTEGVDRITGKLKKLDQWNTIYTELSKELAYKSLLKQYNRKEFARRSCTGAILCRACNNKVISQFWIEELQKMDGFYNYKLLIQLAKLLPSSLIRLSYNFYGKTKKFIR